MKLCSICAKPVPNKKRKYCNDHTGINYYERTEKHKKRKKNYRRKNREYFNEWQKQNYIKKLL